MLESNIKPNIIENLGSGYWYYNYNIQETEGEDLFSDNEDLGGSEPLNLDTELNLGGGETSTGEFEAPEEETTPSEEAILPSPEELGVGDMSDNTNTFETEET